MRGTKRDLAVTKLARSEGWITGNKDFIGTDGHLYLFGLSKSVQRTKVFQRHKSRCAVCGTLVAEFGEPGFCGEMHHTAKCDCLDCLEIRCGQLTGRPCHVHRKVGFRRKAEQQKAIAEFNRLNPPGEEQ